MLFIHDRVLFIHYWMLFIHYRVLFIHYWVLFIHDRVLFIHDGVLFIHYWVLFIHNRVLFHLDVAERVFDRCLSYGQETNPERQQYKITFNYEFLDDTYMPWISEEYRKNMRSDDSSASINAELSSFGKMTLFCCMFFIQLHSK